MISKDWQVKVTGKMDNTDFWTNNKVTFTNVNKADDNTFDLYFNLAEYLGRDDTDHNGGAYCFRPTNETGPTYSDVISQVWHQKGQNVNTLIFKMDNTGNNFTLVFENNSTDFTDSTVHFDVETSLNELNITDGKGRNKVLTMMTSRQVEERTFYTDSNGLFQLKRIWGQHDRWTGSALNVSVNYYPVNTFLYSKSDKGFVAMMPDRAEGGTSRSDGVLELMLHRRLLTKDGKGVGENLNESGPDV